MRIGLIMDFRLDPVLWRRSPGIYMKLDKSCDPFVLYTMSWLTPHVLTRQIRSFYFNGCRLKYRGTHEIGKR